MTQLTLTFHRTLLTLPDGDEVELSPAQARWIDPMRRAAENDTRRSAQCDGCVVFGLCLAHSDAQEERRAG